jgi:phage tail sheath protein FI
VSGGSAFYIRDSRAAAAGAQQSKTALGSYKDLIDDGYDKFTMPMWGAFDGFDITKPDPLYNAGMTDSSNDLNNYIYNTYKRAIDTVADPEFVDMNLLAIPGLTKEGLTTHMIDVCEARADALALIDLPGVYVPPHEQRYPTIAGRQLKSPTEAANDLRARQIDSSYGATFYPWVQSVDEPTGQSLWVPPTVAMMGVLASSEKSSQIWFAPAGFNRGGLSDGAAGIPVTSVSRRLTSKERDILYEARINPIASFPSTGIVVFGQKTLQERPSALDRINVRRLVIFLKKQISILSTQILFEQNVQATWNRFKGLIEPFLANVKTQFGITDYRLILDDSTTTPDLVDQNVVYAKIMIKPARAIEYIAIDFIVASTGASFDD